jgi:RNA polymerase sigma factor (sigma-70 family)
MIQRASHARTEHRGRGPAFSPSAVVQSRARLSFVPSFWRQVGCAMAPSDRDPSFEPLERSDGDAAPRDAPQSAAGSRVQSFTRGEPQGVAYVSALVAQVVRRRGYYIPYDERPDVIQEAIMDLVRAAKGREFADDDVFEGFVRMVAHRRCIDWMRQARKRARIEPEFRPLVQTDDKLLERERRRVAVDVFSRLKRPCRELLALRVGRGLTYAQMAQLLDRSEGALRTQCYHCLKQARIILGRVRRRGTLIKLVDWRKP